MGYLVCNKCGGYYELQEGENPAEFTDQFECGGSLKHVSVWGMQKPKVFAVANFQFANTENQRFSSALKYAQNLDEHVVDELDPIDVVNFCPNCGAEIEKNAKFCTECGEKLDKSRMSHHDLEYNYARPLIHVILLFLITFGLYFFYWYYRNWKNLKKHMDMDINPVLRTIGLIVPIAGIYLIYAQFRDIKNFAEESGVETYSPGLITFGVIFFNLLSRLPSIFWLLTFLMVWPMSIVQKTLNNYWEKEQPGIPMRNKFSGVEIVVMIIGAIFWILAIIGMLIPE